MPSESRRGSALLITLTTAVPLCFAGWLVWGAVADEDDTSDRSGPATTASGRPSPPGTPGGDDGQGAEPGRTPDGTARTAPADGRSPSAGTDDDEGPLAGLVVVLDPGHNVHNVDHPTQINRQVDIGTHRKECDTTGTATNAGYSEAAFTMDVARRARVLLRERGATVRFTHDGERAWGPCVDERARVGNEADADAVVSIHADGALGASARGFHVILPAKVDAGKADTAAIVGPSRRLGLDLREHYAEATSLPYATYLGEGSGLTVRRDLGGLNLSKVPKVFIECGNMRNSTDASVLSSTSGRQRVARGIAEGLSTYLTR